MPRHKRGMPRLSPTRPCALLFAAFALVGAVAAQPTAPAAPASAPAASASAPAAADSTRRPRIGLVLSGGGARGLAHVGVLKVLEAQRVPVDVIAGTSMGAIVGGLYASGIGATQLEAEFGKVDWESLFARRVARQDLSQRRKEEDFEIAPALEIGLRDGELRLPIAGVSSRGLELLLRRYTLPVRGIEDFDRLPIPFRAVATDLETGQPVVFSRGDLAAAMRSSMSVPGVFAPTEIDGRILGDGGLVDNLPVEVARRLGADVVIAVNIGTPLARRDTLGSVIGVTAQMINILTEQNVQRSLAALDPRRDLLIAPPLGELTAGDFARTKELIALGEAHAKTLLPQLARFALPEDEWQRLAASRRVPPKPPGTIAQVRFEGAEYSNPERFAAQLESQPGQPFDVAAAERDGRALAASGDYLRTDYRLEELPAGLGLVFDLEEKPWGPHYFRIGLDLATDFAGRGDFNIKISHNRHWLNADGAEWRNRVAIGSTPRWFTEWYQPLNWTGALANDWFVAAYAEAETRKVSVYRIDDPAFAVRRVAEQELGRYRRTSGRLGLDLGQPWGRIGELRAGLTVLAWENDPEIIATSQPTTFTAQRWREVGLRLHVVMDQLDFASFPTRGWRVEAEHVLGRRRGPLDAVDGGREDFARFELQTTGVASLGRHTTNAFVRALHADQRTGTGLGRYTLGGFQNLSGYKPGQIEGNYLLFGRLSYYYRLQTQPVLTRGLFVGGTLEAGNAWELRGDVSLRDMRTGGSVFLGADTALGPLYFGLYTAPRGHSGVYLLLGRP